VSAREEKKRCPAREKKKERAAAAEEKGKKRKGRRMCLKKALPSFSRRGRSKENGNDQSFHGKGVPALERGECTTERKTPRGTRVRVKGNRARL